MPGEGIVHQYVEPALKELSEFIVHIDFAKEALKMLKIYKKMCFDALPILKKAVAFTETCIIST